MLVYVSIDIQQIPEWDLTMSKYKQVRKHFGAILRYRCKFESYRTFKLCTTQRVLGKFSLKTSSSYTYKREKEREIEWERKDKL